MPSIKLFLTHFPIDDQFVDFDLKNIILTIR